MAPKRSIFQRINRSMNGFAVQVLKGLAGQVASSRFVLTNGFKGAPVQYDKGAIKPGIISNDQLRQIAEYDAIIGICVSTIKKSVSQCDWSIVPMKGKKANPETIEKLTNFFLSPNTEGESLRCLLDMFLEDILILDAGVLEKVYGPEGNLLEMYAIDGATIRKKMNAEGKTDPNEAYAQVIDNEVVSTFSRKEIIYMMQNPQTNVKSYGYGKSPIEKIMLTVQSALQADMYNAKAFSSDNVPPGLIDLGDMSDEQAQAYVAM